MVMLMDTVQTVEFATLKKGNDMYLHDQLPMITSGFYIYLTLCIAIAST